MIPPLNPGNRRPQITGSNTHFETVFEENRGDIPSAKPYQKSLRLFYGRGLGGNSLQNSKEKIMKTRSKIQNLAPSFFSFDLTRDFMTLD